MAPNLMRTHQPAEALALFVSDELSGRAVDQLYPELARHLDLCDRCMQDYIELSELAQRALNLWGGS